jgi:hypothetical protein
MIRLRQWTALCMALMLLPALWAEDKPASPWVLDRALTVSPQAAAVPALKFRLLPLSTELKEGNAVPIYLRLIYEQNDASRDYFWNTPVPWNAMPVDKLPLDEVRKYQQKIGPMLRQFELGARRRSADWNYTFDQGNPIEMLLPDAQSMRKWAPVLVLQARADLAEGNFTKAAHDMETGFAFSRHLAEGPTLINGLVGIAIASQFASVVGDFIERPDAPNLFWSLAALPHPFIDVRKEMEWEYGMLQMVFPELADLDRERTAEQWNGVLRRTRLEFRRMLAADTESGKGQIPEWYPKGCGPDDPASKSPDLPEARKFVARVKGLSAAKVEALPPAQVLLNYIEGTYHEVRDDWYRASFLPYSQARPLALAAMKRLEEAPMTEGHVPGRTLLPALIRVMSRQVQLERNLAALQVVEALRMYAAAHDGKLPESLDAITEAPLPSDPATGKPFEYSREQDTATVVGPNNEPPTKRGQGTNAVRYRVTIRKK